MGNVHIRRASLDDIDNLMGWRMEVLEEVFGKDEVDRAGRTELYAQNRTYYQQALADGSHVACFALDEGQIVACGGICLQREMPSPDNPSGRCAYLMNIYTRPTFQHRGIGSKLVSWLIEEAQREGAQKIYLEASDKGKPLYEELGFEEMAAMMRLA